MQFFIHCRPFSWFRLKSPKSSHFRGWKSLHSQVLCKSGPKYVVINLLPYIMVEDVTWPKLIIFQSHINQFMGFLWSKMPILTDLPPIQMNIWIFRAKYYIQQPKNHWRLNTGNCLSDINIWRSWIWPQLDISQRMALEGEKCRKCPKIRSQIP